MTPLFAATQGSTLGSGMSQSQGGPSSMEAGFVRATQTSDFTPTQDQGRSQTFDWLNPSSQVCVCLSVLPPAGRLFVRPSVYLFVCSPVCRSVGLFVYLCTLV
jgi:hypothetical protein